MTALASKAGDTSAYKNLEYRLNTHKHLTHDFTESLATFFPVTSNLAGTSAATSANYSLIFTADRNCVVSSVVEVHGTKGTDASSVTLQLQKMTGTTAPGSGDNLLSAAIDLKGTINTVQYPLLVTTGKATLAKGDRLGLKTTGTLTAVADVQVTVYITCQN